VVLLPTEQQEAVVLGQRDSQKQKVYDWEDKYVIERDTQYVPFERCQSVVNYIWEQMGWKYPPRVRPQNKLKHAQGSANRTSVYIPEDRGAKTTVLIHELAHSATGDVETGQTEKHGPEFVGVYMKMLDRLVPGLNLPVLMHTAQLSKVKFDITHVPNILDQ
jgi:hypothetical protein